MFTISGIGTNEGAAPDCLGINVQALAAKYPAATFSRAERAREIILYLDGLQADAKKVVDKWPQVVTCQIDRMEWTVAYLRDWGVDVPKAVTRCPQLFSLGEENMEETAEYLQALGLDVPRVLNAMPCVLAYALENLQETVANLDRWGLDAPQVIYRLPSVLGLNWDRNVCPKLEFLINDMERPVSEVDQFPAFLSYSLKARIRPRYEYLRQHQKNTTWSLSYMLTPNDAKFAAQAGTSLEEYLRWRSQTLP